MTRLTVLMTVFNGERYLKQSINSVLKQTYTDFKFLIIDNASTDRSREVILSFNDPRIELVALPDNIGQAAALNRGLDMADTPLVARMDADDISLPLRFERQVSFMMDHPQVGICGTWGLAFSPHKEVKWKRECSVEGIRAGLIFGCCMIHPSVMLRKSLLDRYRLRYDETLGFSEDWDLWIRASAHFPMANIPEYLFKYRLHGESVSSRNEASQKKVDEKIILQALLPLGLDQHPLHDLHKELTLTTTFNGKDRERRFIYEVLDWLQALEAANRRLQIYDEKPLRRIIRERIFLLLRINPQWEWTLLRIFLGKKLFLEAGIIVSFKFIIKVLLIGLGLMGPDKREEQRKNE